MYEYKYVTLDVGGGFWIDNTKGKHRSIIDEHAAQGWRYVGYLPLTFTGSGSSRKIDLIFERTKE